MNRGLTRLTSRVPEDHAETSEEDRPPEGVPVPRRGRLQRLRERHQQQYGRHGAFPNTSGFMLVVFRLRTESGLSW